MKYKIELSKEQMIVIAQSLEDISRFASGRDEVGQLLRQIKRVLLPEMSDNASKTYNASEFIGNTYQIYRSILHQLAKDENWDNVYSYPALPSGNLGTIKIELVK